MTAPKRLTPKLKARIAEIAGQDLPPIRRASRSTYWGQVTQLPWGECQSITLDSSLCGWPLVAVLGHELEHLAQSARMGFRTFEQAYVADEARFENEADRAGEALVRALGGPAAFTFTDPQWYLAAKWEL